MTVAALMSALRARIEQFTDRHDPTALLTAGAVADAQRLQKAATTPNGGMDTSVVQALAWFYWFRHLASPARSNEVEVITATQMFITLAQHDEHLVSAYQLAGLGNSLLERHHRFKDLIDLELAVDLLSQAIQRGRTNPNLFGWIANLGGAFHSIYDLSGDRAYLDLAEEYLRGAAGKLAAPYSGMAWSNLATILLAKYRLDKNDNLLDELVETYRAALKSLSPCQPRTNCLAALCEIHQVRYRKRKIPNDLVAAIDIGEQALASTPPPEGSQLSHVLTRVGSALLARFKLQGRPEDLHRSVELNRAAAATPTDDRQLRYMSQVELAKVLQERFETLSELSDLDSAITILTDAAECLEDQDLTDHAGNHNNLAIAFKARYEAVGEPADLDQAISHVLQAVNLNVTFQRERHLTNLGNMLVLRAEARNTVEDLDNAIRLLGEAVELTPADDEDLHRNLANLGSALQFKYWHTRAASDLETATTTLSKARTSSPRNSPDLAKIGRLLADCMLELHQMAPDHGNHTALSDAVALLTEATETTTAPPIERLMAAQKLGLVEAERGNWQAATQAFATATLLIPLVAWRGVSRASSEVLLARCAGVGSTAAAYAVAIGQPELALEMLETGRAVLWSQLTDLRTDLSALRVADRKLADRLEQVAADLDAAHHRNPIA